MDKNTTPSSSPTPHGTPFLRILALLAFALLIAILSSVGTYWYLSSQQTSKTGGNTTGGEEVMCPQDAKVCPDGSSVTRTGPTCEFAPCPNAAQ